MKYKNFLILAAVILGSILILPNMVFAQGSSGGSTPGIDSLFTNVLKALGPVVNFIIAIATIAGVGFGVACIFKFKQHKDNPQQVPLGQPLALLGIAVMLLWLPFLLKSLGSTMTGGDTTKDDQSTINTGKDAPSWLKGDGS